MVKKKYNTFAISKGLNFFVVSRNLNYVYSYELREISFKKPVNEIILIEMNSF